MSPRLHLNILAAAAFAFPAGIAPVGASSIFSVQTDNWFINSLTNSCIAYNRRPNEYNYSPWNSLTIRAPKAGGFHVQVVFWPKSFEIGSLHDLTLNVEGRGTYRLEAEAIYDHMLETRAAVPGELLKDFNTAKMLTVSTDIPVSLAFDTTRIVDVFAYLDSCRQVIGQN